MKYIIKIKNPIIGVPITYLQNPCPHQFKIRGAGGGIGWNDVNDIKTTITYINAIQHNPDGTCVNGSKINTRATLKYINQNSDDIFYTASNVDYLISGTYMRIFIQKI